MGGVACKTGRHESLLVLHIQNSSCLTYPPIARTDFRGRGCCRAAGARMLSKHNRQDAAESSNCRGAFAVSNQGSSKDNKAHQGRGCADVIF